MKMVKKNVGAELSVLPNKPGVYLFRDAKAQVLYVGKAKTLSKRVKSYFQNISRLEPRKEPMIPQIADIETIITNSEQEALLVEATLIKQHQPPYNVVLKDDKFFLYIRITMSEPYPTVDLVRTITNPKDLYFGPYTGSASVRETLKMLKRIFKFRTCKPLSGKPCFDYTINRCLGVCIGAISADEYRAVVHELADFLRGRGDTVVTRLRSHMMAASAQKRYETAARLRDRIAGLEKMLRRQTVISQKPSSFDVIGMAQDRHYASVAILEIRSGKLIRKQTVTLANAGGQTERKILQAFAEQYYASVPEKPKHVFTEILPDQNALIESTFGFSVHRPQRGDKYALIKIAHENAAHALDVHFASFEKNDTQTAQALTAIQKIFSLSSLPRRIESFDAANIAGQHAVASMAVFIDGKPRTNLYKRFSIRSEKTRDDPAMLAEVVSRRIARMCQAHTGWERPDLIVLDGGKGQLSVVKKTVAQTDVAIIALAKGGHQKPTAQSAREHFFTLDGKDIQLNVPSPELFLLERVRDEAHRFATSYYKLKHVKSQRASLLDGIPGIGPKKKKALLRHFRSIAEIRKADPERIADIIGHKASQILLEHFR